MVYVQNGEYYSFGPEKTERTHDLPQSWNQSGSPTFQGPQSALPEMMETEIRGMPLVHTYGWQLKGDMYFVGRRKWLFRSRVGLRNCQRAGQPAVCLDIHYKPQSQWPSPCTASIWP